MPVNVGEPAVDAVVADGELRVIDAEQVHHRGVDVIDERRVCWLADRMRGRYSPPYFSASALKVAFGNTTS